MKKKPTRKKAGQVADEMRPEYDFRGGIRGKYADRYAEGTNVVLLDPDVAEAFPDSKSVNEILRALLKIIDRRKPTSRSSRGKA